MAPTLGDALGVLGLDYAAEGTDDFTLGDAALMALHDWFGEPEDEAGSIAVTLPAWTVAAAGDAAQAPDPLVGTIAFSLPAWTAHATGQQPDDDEAETLMVPIVSGTAYDRNAFF